MRSTARSRRQGPPLPPVNDSHSPRSQRSRRQPRVLLLPMASVWQGSRRAHKKQGPSPVPRRAALRSMLFVSRCTRATSFVQRASHIWRFGVWAITGQCRYIHMVDHIGGQGLTCDQGDADIITLLLSFCSTNRPRCLGAVRRGDAGVQRVQGRCARPGHAGGLQPGRQLCPQGRAAARPHRLHRENVRVSSPCLSFR